MVWFYNLKISIKLFLSFLVVVTLTVVLGLFAVAALRQVNQASTDLAQRWMPSVGVALQLRAQVARYRSESLQHILSATPADMSHYEHSMNAILAAICKNQQRLDGLNVLAAQRTIAARFGADLDAYVAEQTKIIALSQQQKNDLALALLRGESSRLHTAMTETITELVNMNEQGGEVVSKPVRMPIRSTGAPTTASSYCWA